MQVNGVGTKDEDLGKQDSAYGLDREALRSQIKKTPSSNERDTLQEDMGRYGQLIPLEYSQNVSQEGKAADLVTYGPPKPPCNKARLDNLNELGLLNKASGDPQIREFSLTKSTSLLHRSCPPPMSFQFLLQQDKLGSTTYILA